MYVVHSDWLLFHCDAYLSNFCDVEFSLKLVTSGDQKRNVIHKSCCWRFCNVQSLRVLRRVDSKSFTRIAIAAPQQHSY